MEINPRGKKIKFDKPTVHHQEEKLIHSESKASHFAERKKLTLNPPKLNVSSSTNRTGCHTEKIRLTCLDDKCSLLRCAPSQSVLGLAKSSSRISKIKPLMPKADVSKRLTLSPSVVPVKKISYKDRAQNHLCQSYRDQMSRTYNCTSKIPAEVRFPLGKDVLRKRRASSVELSNPVSAKFLKLGILDSSREKSDVLNSQRRRLSIVTPINNQNMPHTFSSFKNLHIGPNIISQRKEFITPGYKSLGNAGNGIEKASSSFGSGLCNSRSYLLKGMESKNNCDSVLMKEDCGQNNVSCNSTIRCRIPSRTYGNKNYPLETTAEKVFESIKLRRANNSGQELVARAFRKRKLFNPTDTADVSGCLQEEKVGCSFEESNVSLLKGLSNKMVKDSRQMKLQNDDLRKKCPSVDSSKNAFIEEPEKRNVNHGTKRCFPLRVESKDCVLTREDEVHGSLGGKEDAGRPVEPRRAVEACAREDGGSDVGDDELRDGDGSELWPEAVAPEGGVSPPSYLELEEPPLCLSSSQSSTPNSAGTHAEARAELSFLDAVISRIKCVTVEETRKKIIKETGSLERALKVVEIFTQTSHSDIQKKCSELKKHAVSMTAKMERLVSSCDEFLKSFLTKMADLNSIMTRVSRDVGRDQDTKIQVLSEVEKICNERRVLVREEKFI